MSNYPQAELLKEFVRRTEANIEVIKKEATTNASSAYEVTQLVNSLFGMLILPEQKYFDCLSDISNKSVPKFSKIKECVKDCDVKTLNYQNFIKHLRNCVCHPQHMSLVSGEHEIKAISLVDKENGIPTFSLELKPEDLFEICKELCDQLIKRLHL